MIKIKYKDIVEKGLNNNQYYDQSDDDRLKLVHHLNQITYLNIYRTEEFQDDKDWKIFNEEMIKPVKWAKGQHRWKPSVRDMLAQCVNTGSISYNGAPARFSVKQVDNFNKCCDIIAAVWNKTANSKISADEFKVEMAQEQDQQDKLAHLRKFIESKKPNQPNQPNRPN